MRRAQEESVFTTAGRIPRRAWLVLPCFLAIWMAAHAKDEPTVEPAHPDHGHAVVDSPAHTEHGSADPHGEKHGDPHHAEAYSIWSDLPLWSLVAFIGFVAAIKGLGLWNYMLTNMNSREQSEREAIRRVESDLAAAQARLTACRGRMESLDETIRAVLAEADRDAATTRDDILRAAEREAQLFDERARNEIRRVKDQSLDMLFASLAEKVVAVTESRLRSDFNEDDQLRLIGDTLEQLSR